MTASALISALEDGLKKNSISADEKHKSFAKLFARLFRSQFIAFVGNLVVALPVAFALSMLILWLSGEYFVSEAAAKAGVKITNTSKSDPIVMLKHFGPKNPDLSVL